ncbi:MAG: hypothetical protein ACOXZ4_01270 [Sphaerochaetaceae bacterium]
MAENTSDAIKKELKAVIYSKGLSKVQKEELLARVEQNAASCLYTQIVAHNAPSQTQEASGFDFQGKANLCKGAVNSKTDLIEMHLMHPNGELEVLLTEMKELIKDSDEVMVRVHTLPDSVEKIIALNKVFRVRKKRRSLFFQI